MGFLARLAAVVAVLILVLTACAGGGRPAVVETVTITDATGDVEVPLRPERVVVFDMSALDCLDALGVPVVGLPKSNIPDFLGEYAADQYANSARSSRPTSRPSTPRSPTSSSSPAGPRGSPSWPTSRPRSRTCGPGRPPPGPG